MNIAGNASPPRLFAACVSLSIRNAEFRRLLTVGGWNQSRASRELSLDTGTVSRYVGNEIEPSLAVLRLMSVLIGEPVRVPELEHLGQRESMPLTPAELGLIADVRLLPPSARHRAIANLRGLFAALRSGADVSGGVSLNEDAPDYRPSSGPGDAPGDREASAAAIAAAASAGSASAAPGRKRRAGGPIG
jgi:transcriptional regulator with XRE-family HTH domain